MLRVLAVLAVVLGFAATADAKGPLPEPDDGPDPRGLTVGGNGLAWVTAPNRPTAANIERAMNVSRPAALRRAIDDARVRAAALATAAGLTLGDIVAVHERDGYAELGYIQERQPCVRGRCTPPAMVGATVAVTFATAQTSAAASAGRAIVGVGVGDAGVRPRNRRSSASIRAALVRSRIAAAPRALRLAQTDAATLAAGSAMPLGALFSIAEMRRPQQDFSWTFGSFGPGRYCGTVRRTIFRRDSSGRRRPVRRVSERRCFYPFGTEVALRVTYLPA